HRLTWICYQRRSARVAADICVRSNDRTQLPQILSDPFLRERGFRSRSDRLKSTPRWSAAERYSGPLRDERKPHRSAFADIPYPEPPRARFEKEKFLIPGRICQIHGVVPHYLYLAIRPSARNEPSTYTKVRKFRATLAR